MNADEAENIGYVIPSLVVTHFLSLGGESPVFVAGCGSHFRFKSLIQLVPWL